VPREASRTATPRGAQCPRSRRRSIAAADRVRKPGVEGWVGPPAGYRDPPTPGLTRFPPSASARQVGVECQGGLDLEPLSCEVVITCGCPSSRLWVVSL